MTFSVEELSRRSEDLRRDFEAERREIAEDIAFTNARVRDLELWRAEARGSIKALMWVVGIGLGMPATILGIIALFTYGGA